MARGRRLNLASLALVCILLIVLTAPPAGGKISDEGVRKAKRIAADYWNVERGCPPQRVRVRWRQIPSDGYAVIDGCWKRWRYRKILLDRQQRRSQSNELWCSVIVHEYGHLIGRYHSTDPASMMHVPVPLLRRCVRAF